MHLHNIQEIPERINHALFFDATWTVQKMRHAAIQLLHADLFPKEHIYQPIDLQLDCCLASGQSSSNKSIA
jgi:hypothetical protein